MTNETPKTFEEAVDLVMADMRQVLIDRQRKYGPENIRRHGELGLAVRCGDKLARLDFHYFGEGKETPDESLDDSWTDLGNYATIALMVRKGWWGLPMADEAKGACQHKRQTADGGMAWCVACGAEVKPPGPPVPPGPVPLRVG